MTTHTVDQAAAIRINNDVAALADVGLRFRDPLLYEVGTYLEPSGVNTYRRSRQEFEKRPTMEETYDKTMVAWGSQYRQDYKMANLADIDMTSDVGNLRHMSPEEYINFGGANQLALGQLVARMGGPETAGPYLSSCPPSLRAMNINTWAAAAKTAGKARPGLVRTMLDKEGKRGVYAVLSRDYKVRDLPECQLAFRKALEKLSTSEARGEFRMAGPRWTLRATFHSALLAELARVGEVFRAAVWVAGVDDGTGSVRVGVGVERARCVNLTTISVQEIRGLRHNSRDFDAKLQDMLAHSVQKVAYFAEAWGEAAKQQVVEKVYDNLDPQAVFGELVRRGLVKIPGVSPEDMVERLVRAWRVEPGYARTDIINAITRAAHTETWKSPWVQDSLEEQAGNLVYNKLVLA